MRSSFIGLELQKRSIQMSQKALDITGNNLSNISTEGYTRQRVDLYANYLGSQGAYTTRQSRLAMSGQGVFASGVSQIRDSYIDKRYREMTCQVAESDNKSNILSEIETALDNFENTGMTYQLDQFKSALRSYAADSADREELASLVRNQAYNITKLLQTQASSLDALQEETVYSLGATVDTVNTLISKIVDYNKSIVNEYAVTAADCIFNGVSVTGGYGPNELLDERNLLLDELSNYGDISVEQNDDGSVKVTMGGTTIIDGEKSINLIMKDFKEYGAAVLKFDDGTDVNLNSGEIKGYVDMLNGNGPYASAYQSDEYGIPYYKSSVNAFADAFSSLMNTLNGADKDPSRAMFSSSNDYVDANGNTVKTAITASSIRVSDSWMKEATMIGKIYNEDTGAYDYPTNLDGTAVNKLLLGLENTVKVGGANDYQGSVYDYVLFLSNRLGQSISFTTQQGENASATANSLLDSRDALSGVSDTEEGINMLSYSKWFNASSRMLTTLDEALNTIINNMGLVGR